jgi:hypothetical protein
MNKTIIAAGSGPSYSKWQHWPTWTKMFPMAYKANLIDASGPAAGNKFLYRSVLTRLQNITPDLVLMQWNLGKFDVYVENPEFINSIINGAGIRNFLIDIHTGNTTTDLGYWCSSTDNTIPWKRMHNELVKNKRGTALDDLDSMINLQNICAKKGIDYKFFCHDTINHEYFSTDQHIKPLYNEIDWEAQVFPSVKDMFRSHESFQFDTSGKVSEFHWVPNADWQYWFLTEMVSKLTDHMGITRRLSWEELKTFCHNKTLECYAKIDS